MRTIKMGIIGGGLMGRELASAAARFCHILDAPASPEIIAVASRRLESTAWFTANFPSVRQTTADYRELLANPEVEAIYCAVP
ncbi:MAG: Gfo/Idh/MocA family oxidoreductase, partial [Planctomycetota bacterium]|nr:Gfo/Idh/MocA family oxidoreductase [Planctomycetota bacterium]